MSQSSTKTVLFYRDFRGFTGGHLKVWHYFNHTRASDRYAPKVYFSKDSVWNEDNPWWHSGKTAIASTWAPFEADVLVLGGMDWTAMPAELLNIPRVPIINLVQGLRHADPCDPRYEFLKHRAIRICSNLEVEKSLRLVPDLNGPIVYVPMGLDLHNLPSERQERYDVVIAAIKAPELGSELAARLRRRSRRVELLTKKLPRRGYLQKIADGRVAVLLPLPLEGFYLPLLEAMAMGRIAVCPDCVANRTYCIPRFNGFRPDYDAQAIEDAVESALALSTEGASAMSANAAQTASAHTLERERDAFLNVLSNLDALWNREDGR